MFSLINISITPVIVLKDVLNKWGDIQIHCERKQGKEKDNFLHFLKLVLMPLIPASGGNDISIVNRKIFSKALKYAMSPAGGD